MIVRYLLALLLSCWMSYAWTQAPDPGKTPQEAPLLPLCLLDGYQYNTCSFPFPGYVPPPFCGSVENNGFLGFIATFSDITFTITPGNCTGTPTGSGVQAEVYGIECNPFFSVSNVYSVSPCQIGGFPDTLTLTASGLGYGQVYYLMIDGYAGDCCDYQIDVIDYTPINPPPPAPPFINGPATVYVGQAATYTVEFPQSNSIVENTCQSPFYPCPGSSDTCFINIANPTWTVPPDAAVIADNFLSIDVLWGFTGGEVCVSFPTTCWLEFEICLEVTVLPPQILVDTAYICLGDVYTGYGQTFFQPGVYDIPIDPATIVQLVLLPDYLNCLILPQDTLSPGATYLLDFLLIGDPSDTQILWQGPGISAAEANLPSPEISLPGWYTLTVIDTISQCHATDASVVWYLNTDCIDYQYPIPFSDSLSGAPLFCASNLQPYCSTTEVYSTDTIPGLDTLDNGQWFRFQACESEVIFELFAYNCNQNDGVEAALYYMDTTGAGVQVVSPLQSIGNGFTDTLTFTGLLPGAFYIMLIDGVDGDVCEFQLTHLSGLSAEVNVTIINEVLADGYIDGPTEVCPLIPATYTLIPPVCEWSVTVDGGTSCPIPYQQVCEDAPDSILWIYPTAYDTIWTIPDSAAQWLSDSIGSSVMMWFTDTIGGTITAQIVPVLEDSVWIEGSCYVLCGNLSILDLCPKEFSIDVDVIFNIETLPPIGICPGECVDFCGELYCTEGTYSCGDSCTLQVQPVFFLPPQIVDYGMVEICQGDCFFWNNQLLCDPGNYNWFGQTYNGCDSIEFIQIQVLPPQIINLGTISLCEGDCFDWNGQLFCDPGFFTWAEPGSNGCLDEYLLVIEAEPVEVVTVTAITVDDCDPVTQTFVVQVDLYTDFPPIYVNGIPMAGFTFISDPMPSGTYFAFEFTDNNPCSFPNFVDGTQTCLCLTEGGSMGSNTLYGCPESVVSGDYLGGAVLDGNDQQVFVLHTAPGATLGTPLKISSTPEIEYDAAAMSFGTTYYLSSVVGSASGGQIDWNDVCLAVSPGQPVIFYPEPEVSIPTPSALSCFQPQVTLSGTVSGGSPSLEIKWLQGTQFIGTGTTLDVSSPGNYTLQTEDLLTGCIGLANVEITGNPEGPTEMTLEETPPLCYGQNDGILEIADVIGGTAPYQYQVDDLPLSDQAVFQGLSPGPHNIEVIDVAGCSLSQAINWDFPLELTIDPGPNLEVPLGTLVEISPIYNFTPQQVNWLLNGEPGSGLTLQFEAFENTTMTILAIAESGCTAQAALSIQVFEDASVYLPNIFSPNADGQNDRFFPQGGAQIARIVDWRIFDRWGTLVYEQPEMLPGDKSKGWDGTIAGKPCPVGLYAYMLTVEYQNGDKELVKGGVTLVR